MELRGPLPERVHLRPWQRLPLSILWSRRCLRFPHSHSAVGKRVTLGVAFCDRSSSLSELSSIARSFRLLPPFFLPSRLGFPVCTTTGVFFGVSLAPLSLLALSLPQTVHGQFPSGGTATRLTRVPLACGLPLLQERGKGGGYAPILCPYGQKIYSGANAKV